MKKINAEETNLTTSERFDLVISPELVVEIMGPEPIPSLIIEIVKITDPMLKMMVTELVCMSCKEFPYKPVECDKCHKLLCLYC